MVGIIIWLIVGGIVGWLASLIMRTDAQQGIFLNIVVGIVGAILGGFLAGVLFDADPLDEFFDISTWLTAIVGAIILLAIYRAVTGRRRSGVLR